MSAVSSSSPSSKKRRRPNLDPSRPLHVTTNVKSTGLGDAAAALPRSLGQGKRRVWCGSAAAASMLLEASTTAPPAAPRPVVESLRSLKVRSLTKLVNTLCHDANGAAPPVLALERWLLNALASHDDEEELGEASRADPLLPGGGGGGGGGDESFAMRAANDNLVADLIRGSIPAKVATQIAGKVAAASVAAAAEVAALERRLGAGSEGSSKSKKKKRKKKQQQPVAEGGGQQQGAPDVMVEEHRHSVDVYLPGKGKHVLKLNHEHYQKLRGLWDLRQVERRDSDAGTGGDAGARVDADADADADASADIGGHDADRRFRDALFVLLSRYFALQGRGFQAACSEHVQELLGDELKVWIGTHA